MDRRLKGLLAAAMAVTVAAAAWAPVWAQDLPANIHLTLKLSAKQSGDALLDAVRQAIEARPEFASEIIDAAILLQPALAEDIRLAAAITGEIEVTPAAGPLGLALGPLLAGAGAAGTAAAVAGGGSGSGGGGAANPAPPVVVVPLNPRPQPPGPPGPPGTFETTEYFASKGLAAVNASDAYGRGLTGAGVVVAILDTGLDINHPEFAGRVAPGGFSFINNNADITDGNGHGTHVAGIIAANKDGAGMQGLAYGAGVLPIQIFAADGTGLSTVGLAAATDYAIDSGAFVVNNSWGINGKMVTDFTTAQILAAFGPEIAAYRRAAAADRVIVFAAHNAALDDPSPRAGLPYHVPDLQPYWLAVVATDQTGSIASYSNRCGVAAAWCLAAPGSAIVSAAPGGGYATKWGTSMAAPHVTAAVAVLKQLFPELSADVIVERLLATANDSGIYADPLIYGQGLLDLEAATRPVGTTEVLTGATVAGASFQLTNTAVRLSAAFGDGLQSALSGVKLAVFDSQRATFFVDLAPFVQIADTSIDLPALIKRFGDLQTKEFAFGEAKITMALTSTATGAGKVGENALEEFSIAGRISENSSLSLSYNTDPALAFGLHGSGTVDQTMLVTQNPFAAPYLSMTDETFSFATSSKIAGLGDLRVTSFSGNVAAEGEFEGKGFGTAMELSMQPAEAATVAVQFGIVAEGTTFLGTATQGAFGFAGNTPTMFSGLSGELALTDKLSLVGSVYTGVSTPRPATQSLFTDVSPIQSQSFSIGLVGRGLLRPDDGFGAIINQPLRVARGTADIALTSGRDAAGNLSVTNFEADLTPSGRELDFEIFYNLPLGDVTSLTASAALRIEPGHIADANDEGILALRFRHKF